MRHIKYNRKKALTLIEVVISLAILFIIMIPVSTMAIQSIKTNKQAEEKQRATILAQKLMEKIKSLPEFNIDTLPMEDGVTIEKDKASTADYNIEGTVDGFKVEGTVKASKDYKSENIDETSKIQTDAVIRLPKDTLGNIYINGKLILGNPKNFTIVKKDNFIELDFNNGTKENIESKKSTLEIVVDKDSRSEYKIHAYNNTEEALKLYCYKYKDCTATFNITNEKGKVVYFDNLLKQDSPLESDTINRVYDIYIKVSKGNSYYEIESNKALVK